MSATLGDAILYLKSNNTALEAGLRDAENKTNNWVSGALGNVSASMAKAGGFMTGLVTLPILGAAAAIIDFGKDAVQSSADFEKGMSSVQAKLGATNEEMAKLNTHAEELGLDPNLVVSTVQAAEAMDMLAKNGMTVEQILDGATRATVLLANATGADLGPAAGIATSAMKIFNIDAKDMIDAVSGITSVTIKSKFTIDDYAQALGNGGGAAKAMGVEFDDFNTTIAAISPSFSSGAEAGTNFKTMLQYLPAKTKPTIAAMKELGLITEDGKNQFYDAEGNLKSMSEITGILAEATNGLSEEERSRALSTIFGTDAMRTAAALAAFGKEKFDALGIAMGKVDAEEQARTRLGNLAGTLEILKGIVEAVRLRIGDAFNPAIDKMASTLSNFLSQNAPKIIMLGDQVGKALAAALPMITNFIMNVATAIINWATAFAKLDPETQKFILAAIGIAAAIGPLLLVLAGVAGLLGTLLTPIGLVIATIAILAAAWMGNWFGIRDTISQVIATIGPLIQGLFVGIQTWWSENGATVLAAMQTAWNGLMVVFQMVGAVIGAVIAALMPIIAHLFSQMQTGFLNAAPLLAAFSQLWTALQPVLQALGIAFVVMWGVVASVLGGILTALHPFIQMVVDLLTGLTTIITGILNVLVGAFTGNFSLIGTGVVQIVTGLVTTLQGLFTGICNTIAALLVGFVATFIGYWTGLSTNVSGIVSSFISSIIGQFTSMVAGMQSAGSSIIQGLIDGIQGNVSQLLSIVQKIADKIKNTISGALGIHSPSAVMMDIGANISEGLALGIQGAGDLAVQAMGNLSASIASGGAQGISGGQSGTVFSPNISIVINGNADGQTVKQGAIDGVLQAARSMGMAGI